MTAPSQVLIPQSALAFQYRMGTGFPGTITRMASLTVEPGLIDSLAPPAYFGQGVVYDGTAQAFRPPAIGDTFVGGVTVRAFPMKGNFPATPQVDPLGTANVPLSGGVGILRRGYIAVTLSGSSLTPIRYTPVYLWLGATSGVHVNGGFETAYSASFTTVAAGAGGGGSNTGNGTFTAGPALATAPPVPGAYAIKFTSATAFTVTDPNGVSMPPGTVGTAYNDAKITFTITAGGTPYVAGDGYTVSMLPNTLLLPSSYFMGPPDASGVTELAFNI